MKKYFLVLTVLSLAGLSFRFFDSPIYGIKQEINFPFRGQDIVYEKKYTFIKTDSLSIFEMHAFTGADDPNGGTVQVLKDTINYFCWKEQKGLIYHPFFQENRSVEILTNPDSVVNKYVGGFPQMDVREKDYKLESVKDSLGLSKRFVYSIKSNEHFMSPDTIKLLLIKEKYELYHSFSKKIEAEHGMTLTDVRFIFNAKKHENKDYPKLEGYLTLRKVEIKENAFLSAVLKQFEIDKKLLK